ncbi:hypothetical protein Dimus_024561 [Dionaea muscipula]
MECFTGQAKWETSGKQDGSFPWQENGGRQASKGGRRRASCDVAFSGKQREEASGQAIGELHRAHGGRRPPGKQIVEVTEQAERGDRPPGKQDGEGSGLVVMMNDAGQAKPAGYRAGYGRKPPGRPKGDGH